MPNFLSSPSTVNAPGTFRLRKPRLAQSGILKPIAKFAQPAGVPHFGPVQKSKVKMVSVKALAGLPKLPRIPKI